MTMENAAVTDRPTLGMRTGSSRKLLARKAAEKSFTGSAAETGGLEADFPTVAIPGDSGTVAEPTVGVSEGSAATEYHAMDTSAGALLPASSAVTPAPLAPAATPPWSDEDETALQALVARRKAAGHRRRGKDVGGLIVSPGAFKPNPDTVVDVIVAIVAKREGITRSELIDAMASATFPHAKARPADKGWCQGYVAGAIRNGFLTLVDQSAAKTDALS